MRPLATLYAAFLLALVALAATGCHSAPAPVSEPIQWPSSAVVPGNWPDAPLASYRQWVKPRCEWCGTTKDLNVCHIIPQAVAIRTHREYLITSEVNVVTLCRRDHIVLSHMGDDSCQVYNPNVCAILALKKLIPIRGSK